MQQEVPETILVGGKKQVIMLDAKYKPYSRRDVRVENICGSFSNHVEDHRFQGVAKKTRSCFGTQLHLFHLEGNITLHRNRVTFMGVRGIKGLEAIQRTLEVESPIINVHMAVFCLKLGKRVQVRTCGYAELNLLRYYPNVVINNRLYEQSNMIHFQIKKFDGVFTLPEHIIPLKNNWTLTGKGTVIARITWKNLKWSREVEAECLRFCSNVGEILDAAS